MQHNTDISLTIKNGKHESKHLFENEDLSITRATKLWIENSSETESDFIKTIMLCHETDLRTKSMSSYIIETSKSTPIQTFRQYYIGKIDKTKQSLTFEWNGY